MSGFFILLPFSKPSQVDQMDLQPVQSFLSERFAISKLEQRPPHIIPCTKMENMKVKFL